MIPELQASLGKENEMNFHDYDVEMRTSRSLSNAASVPTEVPSYFSAHRNTADSNIPF
jgi:hypothetical protein